MDLLLTIIILIAIVLVSNALAFLVSTSKGVPEVKPFNCYACLAFWLTIFLGAGFAWMHQETDTRAILGYVAVVSALLNFFYVKSKYNVTL